MNNSENILATLAKTYTNDEIKQLIFKKYLATTSDGNIHIITKSDAGNINENVIYHSKDDGFGNLYNFELVKFTDFFEKKKKDFEPESTKVLYESVEKNEKKKVSKKTVVRDKDTHYTEKVYNTITTTKEIPDGTITTIVKTKEKIAKKFKLKDVEYDGKKYCVGKVKYQKNDSDKKKYYLFIISAEDKDKINEYTWHYKPAGDYIGHTLYVAHEIRKTLYLHNAVMDKLTFDGKSQSETVDHINRCGRDNRRENLRFASQANQNYNQKKRDRDIDLSEYGIDSNNIPRCIWLQKESKGDEKDKYLRFVVEIPGINYKGKNKIEWKTTKSEKYSLEAKLEMAKKFINTLFDKFPQLYNRGIITEYTPEQIEKMREFNDIIKLSGYPQEIINANLIEIPTKQKKYLDINYEFENDIDTEAVKNFNPEDEINEEKTTKRKFGANMPTINGELLKSLPKYTYFSATTDKQGCKFTIDRHPGLIAIGKKTWSTTTSKGVSVEDKYSVFLEKLAELDKAVSDK
jgi:hypothetical protein